MLTSGVWLLFMKLNKIIRIFLLSFSLLLSSTQAAWAVAIPVRINLNSIEATKTSEKSGDELYFDITQYSNQGHTKTLRVPAAPLHWLSKQLPDVKNALLWEGMVEENEEMKVIVSLVEQDNPPWDVDDLIGSALLILDNRQGVLRYRWELPVFEERVEQQMLKSDNPQSFIMKGDNSNYNVSLQVMAEKLQKMEASESPVEPQSFKAPKESSTSKQTQKKAKNQRSQKQAK